MDDDAFLRTLRINILELLKPKKTNKIRKKLSDLDILGQLNTIYSVSERKPTGLEVGEAIIFMLDRNIIEEHPLGDVQVYAMTDKGVELLEAIYDGDDTAII